MGSLSARGDANDSANGSGAAVTIDMAIVGAGFAGLYMLHRARGLGLSAIVIEAADGVGGTWYWNRYPGARCDIDSLEYSFSFDEALQQEWNWSERFATQPEILRYANHVADRFDLRRDIRLSTRLVQAAYDETAARWQMNTEAVASGGQAGRLQARYLVMATGCLSSANLPPIPGLRDFAGATYHTGRWPHTPVDFTGQRVGVIGTGSSAIQSIPIIASQASSLHVFQRTPNYSVPAHNAPLDPAHVARIKADYAGFRARNRQMLPAFGSEYPKPAGKVLESSEDKRREVFERWWARGGLGYTRAFEDLMLSGEANQVAAQFVRDKIREIVKDPGTAASLCPEQMIGCKRLCVDTDYFATYNLPHVHLVDLRRDPIERITPTGVALASGEQALDALVLATGFDAMTGALLRIDIRGVGGRTLGQAWEHGPRNYLGLSVAGFPNLFMITGPGSPSVLTNMMMSIEQHVDWIADCVRYMQSNGLRRIAAREADQDAWVGHVNQVADATVFPQCNSWYLGANIPGKPRVFMPLLGFPDYAARCEAVAQQGYSGFEFG